MPQTSRVVDDVARPTATPASTPAKAPDIGLPRVFREAPLQSAAQVREYLKDVQPGSFFPSPQAWEDQVLYFLMLDRFSDGKETDYRDNAGQVVTRPQGTARFQLSRDAGNDKNPNRRDCGRNWCGGTLHGAASKLGYLRRLGVTAVWISPVFKQIPGSDSYHGYGIQNFLDVDPHFAREVDGKRLDARQELRDFIKEAHKNGIYVILDVVINHTGDVFAYEGDGKELKWDGNEYPVRGFRGKDGSIIPAANSHRPLDGPIPPDQFPDGAVWPAELQRMGAFTRKGQISNWDWFPEYLDGDFFSLKNVNLGTGDTADYTPSPALVALTDCYKYWIAYADVDGYRIDTVKHIELGAARYFASTIHEFTQRIGKERFYLIGEITGGRQRAVRTLEETGIDAALGINEVAGRLSEMILGRCEPNCYFSLFRNSMLVHKESQLWFNDKVVTMYDDHDMVGRQQARLCAHFPAGQPAQRMALLALAVNITTMGIPCIYYGSEQCFNGGGGGDEMLREAMFGGSFGSMSSSGRHFFDEDAPVYQKLSELIDLRDDIVALRRGRQYLREISGEEKPQGEIDFGFPTGYGGCLESIIAWSRVFDDQEVLLAMNTCLSGPKTMWVTVDSAVQQSGELFSCIYDSNDAAITDYSAKLRTEPVAILPSGRKALHLTLEPGELLIFANPRAIRAAQVASQNAASG